MKFIFMPRIYVLIALILSIGPLSFSLRSSFTTNDLYKNKGKDWTGTCATGEKQSPINIILGSNTLGSPNHISVEYVLNDSIINKQLFFDGERLSMDVNLGNLIYSNVADGVKETYEAYKIEIHYPSEHYVTINNKTPRYEIELQIFHNLKQTNNQVITNSQIKVNRAILSILFTMGHQGEGDIFFNNLGISKYNKNQYGEMNIPKIRETIKFARTLPASYGTGINYNAFQGLLNLINADPQMFFYYGSETSPPCREDVLWMIFAQPRSLGQSQVEFLRKILLKANSSKTGKIPEPQRLFGNTRKIVLYNDRKRGKILYSNSGLKQVTSSSFFSKENTSTISNMNSSKESKIMDIYSS